MQRPGAQNGDYLAHEPPNRYAVKRSRKKSTRVRAAGFAARAGCVTIAMAILGEGDSGTTATGGPGEVK